MFGFLSNVMNFADANKFFNNGFQNIMKFNPFDFQTYFNNNSSNNDAKENLLLKIIHQKDKQIKN